MSNRVDFYLLKNQNPSSIALTACRIAEKAYKQNHKVYLLTETHQDKEALNMLLWTFQELSFVPHALWEGTLAEDVPVYIDALESSSPAPFHDILINLTKTVPPHYEAFQRIIEIVCEEETQRESAREKYRCYRQQQCQLSSHTL